MAHEYGKRGIRANVVSPGPIASEGFLAYLNSVVGSKQKMEDGVPIRRLGLPEHIANTALFLASDEASYVSGVVIPVDGGRANRIVALTSTDDWATAKAAGIAPYEVMASTVAVVGADLYVVHPHFRDDGLPSVERVTFR